MDLAQLCEKEDKLQKQINNINRELNDLRQQKKFIQAELDNVKRTIKILNSEVYVTDHAIVRYFERCLNYNIDEIRTTICPSDVKKKVKVLTNCKYPVKDFEIVVKDNKIVTVQK